MFLLSLFFHQKKFISVNIFSFFSWFKGGRNYFFFKNLNLFIIYLFLFDFNNWLLLFRKLNNRVLLVLISCMSSFKTMLIFYAIAIHYKKIFCKKTWIGVLKHQRVFFFFFFFLKYSLNLGKLLMYSITKMFKISSTFWYFKLCLVQ